VTRSPSSTRNVGLGAEPSEPGASEKNEQFQLSCPQAAAPRRGGAIGRSSTGIMPARLGTRPGGLGPGGTRNQPAADRRGMAVTGGRLTDRVEVSFILAGPRHLPGPWPAAVGLVGPLNWPWHPVGKRTPARPIGLLHCEGTGCADLNGPGDI
jgi:hypothetical protein